MYAVTKSVTINEKVNITYFSGCENWNKRDF